MKRSTTTNVISSANVDDKGQAVAVKTGRNSPPILDANLSRASGSQDDSQNLQQTVSAANIHNFHFGGQIGSNQSTNISHQKSISQVRIQPKTGRCGSAYGVNNHKQAITDASLYDVAADVHYGGGGVLTVQPPLIMGGASSAQSQSIHGRGPQRSGKAFFGKKSMGAGDAVSTYSSDSQQKEERKLLKQLLDNIWPKDPLEEQRELQRNNEMVEISDLMDAISRDQVYFPERESEIKQNLQRITTTELKLSDMISRHIKKHGSLNFNNSSFVVTNRSNNLPMHGDQMLSIRPLEQPKVTEKSTPVAKNAGKKVPAATSRAQTQKRQKSKSAVRAAAAGVKPINVKQQLKNIMDSSQAANKNKGKPLQHFKPKELFNINTHALFQKTKVKDPLDSEDDSQDDEDEINRILHSKEGQNKFGPEEREKLRNAKIDLKAYDPSNKIEHNIKLLRNMINQAKQATNTDRTASLAQGRREQLKITKFFKKDSSNIKQSKIARETDEAIKYLNKRQPLTVQNTQEVDDEQLFSIPKRGRKTVRASVNRANTYTNDTLGSPNKKVYQLQLQHEGERAKFFRNVRSVKHDKLGVPQQSMEVTMSSHGQPMNLFARRRHTKAISQVQLQESIMPVQGVVMHTRQGSALRMSRSSSRSKLIMNPSTYSKTTGKHNQQQQQAMLLMQSFNKPSVQDQIESDCRSLEDSPQTFPKLSASKQYPSVIVNQPKIINNISLIQQPSYQNIRKTKKSSQSHKRFASNPVRRVVKPMARKATHVDMVSRISEKEAVFSAQTSQDRHKNHKAKNQSGEDLSVINFHPTGGIGTPYKNTNMDPTSGLTTHPSTRLPGAAAGVADDTSAQAYQVFNADVMGAMSHTELQSSSQPFSKHHRGKSIPEVNFVGHFDTNSMARINETMESRSFHASANCSFVQEQPWNQNTVAFNNELQSIYVPNGSLMHQGSQKILNRKKSSAIVKVEQTVLEKVPTLNVMEMLRVLDARNEDMGLKKQNTDKCTVDGLERLVLELTDGNGQGPAQRFRDYCDRNCVNRRLVLQKYQLGPIAAQEIARILAVNSEIVHADLGKNNLGDQGAEIISNIVQNHTSMIHLDLSQNNISPKGAKKVFKALTNNISLISLKMGNTENVNKNRLSVLAVPKLNELLQKSKIMQFLDLRSTNLTDAGLAMLVEGLPFCSTLFNLNLAKNDITSSGMEKFAPILHRTAISELDISLNPLGNNGVRCLAENLWAKVYSHSTLSQRETISVTELNLRDVDKYSNGKKCALLKLNLSETKLQESGANHLFKNLLDFYSLQYLNIDHNCFQVHKMSVFSSLVKQSRLHTLSMNYCKLGNEGGVSLGDALLLSNSMRDLRAKSCDFGDTAAKAFAACLEDNPTIERLDLSNNLINDAGGELLGISIAQNQNLKYLNLRKNNMRATSGAMFAKSMFENKTLKCLKLENNYINISFLEEVARFIERNNLHMLENNVEELRQDRQGFVETRLAKWKKVIDDKQRYDQKANKLTNSVIEKKDKRAKLAEDLKQEIVDLEENLDTFKQQESDYRDDLYRVSEQIEKCKKDHEKHFDQQFREEERMKVQIKNLQIDIELKQEMLNETRQKTRSVEMRLEMELEKADRKAREAKEENQKIKDQIAALRQEAIKMKLISQQ